ncbi:putative peptidoglycan binding domain protein [Clostridium puniceum]|uniref:Putative peptidoglycan binding domain protein n=1 Tax=Clostridium puniceum TaxID=29367 RepID=A0A1S8TEB8_9CLOT|nr:L,D-transpeptidase family protein [Clostridium puniceum]OOM75972.1 putative peptidoglycan binding domain protein [Clostridium puniceum]
MEAKKNRSDNIIKYIIVFSITLLSLYLIFAVNIIKVSAKTLDEKSSSEYTLTLYEAGGIKEQINGVDIKLSYNSDQVYYDETLLNEAINKLLCLAGNSIFKSQDPTFVYENNTYTISKELYGNSINKNILYENITKAIKNKEKKINLEKLNCYEKPNFTSNSKEVIKAKDILNKYVSSRITYNYEGLVQVLDGYKIKDFISVDGNFQVILDETKIKNYVDNLANSYNSALGTSIPVNGGYYGNNHSWIIDSLEETKVLIQNIKNGQTVTKNPIYKQTSAANYFSNIGNTFVEIDMTKQHLWYYKDGYLVVDGDVVTGNVSNGTSTPEGVYKLYSKEKDTVLRGEDYASPVSFWMPFNKNIGLHDANWRIEFGSDIYINYGSHGCVNAPYYVAKTVYENINIGTFIICHY